MFESPKTSSPRDGVVEELVAIVRVRAVLAAVTTRRGVFEELDGPGVEGPRALACFVRALGSG